MSKFPYMIFFYVSFYVHSKRPKIQMSMYKNYNEYLYKYILIWPILVMSVTQTELIIHLCYKGHYWYERSYLIWKWHKFDFFVIKKVTFVRDKVLFSRQCLDSNKWSFTFMDF